MTFTKTDLAKPFGQDRAKPQRRGARQLPARQISSLGNNDPGLTDDFMQGVRASQDRRTKTLIEMAVAYAGVRAWSMWRSHGRP